MRTREALRRAVLAALAAPVLACSSSPSDGSTCVYDRPDVIPTPSLDGSSGCDSVTYDVTVSNLSSCGLDVDAASLCTTVCGAGIAATCTQAGNTFTCKETVCGKARTSLRRRRRSLDPFKDYLRASTWLEAASIAAFYTLSDELEAHAAPRSLVVAARAAARDERRHARSMASLARKFGVATRFPSKKRRAVRPLLVVATENVVEGLVRETFGACVAAFQASVARDARVRAAMRRIAEDEAKHAMLARRVAIWANTRLTARERARVARSRDAAVEELVSALGAEPPSDLAATLGVPTSTQALAIAHALRVSLWAT